MALSKSRPTVVAAIIERSDQYVLIVLPAGQPDLSRLWRFPCGQAEPGESPESAMRRIAQSMLGIAVEIVVGQPPWECHVDDQTVVIRYFYCGIIDGEATRGPYSEIRWVPPGSLCEYDFDPLSQPVAGFLAEQRRL